MHPHRSRASVPSGSGPGLLAGKFDFAQSSRGVLTRSGLFVGLCESFATLCARVRAFDTSVWALGLSGSPMHGSVPLAGKSRLSDAFAGILELPASLCVYACMFCASISSQGLSGFPTHSFAPLAGNFGLADAFTGILELFSTLCV